MIRRFHQAASVCVKCGANSGQPTWVPPKALRGIRVEVEGQVEPIIVSTFPRGEETGARFFTRDEVRLGQACLPKDCPEADHLHWTCRECAYVWSTTPKDAA